MHAVQMREDGPHFVGRQHDRQPALGHGPADLDHPGQLHFQHLPIKEQQCRQGLAVRGSRHLTIGCQMGQKPLDFVLSHFGRVAQRVEPDKRAAPVNIGFFGAQAVVHQTNPLAQAVQQFDGAQRWQRHHFGLRTRPGLGLYLRERLDGWRHGYALVATSMRPEASHLGRATLRQIWYWMKIQSIARKTMLKQQVERTKSGRDGEQVL
jgi:hypothetical protein